MTRYVQPDRRRHWSFRPPQSALRHFGRRAGMLAVSESGNGDRNSAAITGSERAIRGSGREPGRHHRRRPETRPLRPAEGRRRGGQPATGSRAVVAEARYVVEVVTMPDDITMLSATNLLGLYRRRELSPVEATRAVLERIDARNAAINAYCLVRGDEALAAARQSELRWRDGRPQGLLDGVPVSVKDLLPTGGWPTRRGSLTIGEAGPWNADAPAVARLREQGAVLLGKTTTPEFGWKGVTDAPLTGVTRNPWDPARTSGGSSGGSAAAVASGLGPLSVGTDGAGSVRIPASFCGIVGLKPTQGRVPVYPPSTFGTLSHVGPMARTVADAALLLEVIGSPDPRDSLALDRQPAPGAVPEISRLAGRQVAFSPDLGYATVDPEVAAAVRGAAAALEAHGARVSLADPGFASPRPAFDVLWCAGTARIVADIPAGLRHLIDPGLAEMAEAGRRCSAVDYLQALRERAELGAAMGAFYQTYDLLVTPTEPIVAFAAGAEVPDGSADPRWPGWTPFTYPFNMTHQPAATVPCGFSAGGLPIGVQVVGPRHADALVLSACAAIEAELPWHDRWPE
jgi:aspartyl-tRNA(Asn)/glutamyl-tRNA(Gln) amidotransferase subunit A